MPKPPSVAPPKPPVPKAEPVKKSAPKKEEAPAPAESRKAQSPPRAPPPPKKAAKSKKKKKQKEELKPSVADMLATDDEALKRLQALEGAVSSPSALEDQPSPPSKEPTIPQELKGLPFLLSSYSVYSILYSTTLYE